MKEELLKNIERTASDVRSAKAEVEKAKESVESQFEAIESLKKSLVSAGETLTVRVSEREAKLNQLTEAITRYNFYTAEAVNHPY